MTSHSPYSLLKALDRYTDSPPPVMDWRPPSTHDIDIRIDRAGAWIHEGTQLDDQSVRMLASILRKDGATYYLVTPEEKCRIEVEEVPFIAIRMDVIGKGQQQTLSISTDCGDQVALDEAHPVRFGTDSDSGAACAYITVRNSLEAIFTTELYDRLTDLLVQDDSSTVLGVWSSGSFSVLCKATAVF